MSAQRTLEGRGRLLMALRVRSCLPAIIVNAIQGHDMEATRI